MASSSALLIDLSFDLFLLRGNFFCQIVEVDPALHLFVQIGFGLFLFCGQLCETAVVRGIFGNPGFEGADFVL